MINKSLDKTFKHKEGYKFTPNKSLSIHNKSVNQYSKIESKVKAMWRKKTKMIKIKSKSKAKVTESSQNVLNFLKKITRRNSIGDSDSDSSDEHEKRRHNKALTISFNSLQAIRNTNRMSKNLRNSKFAPLDGPIVEENSPKFKEELKENNKISEYSEIKLDMSKWNKTQGIISPKLKRKFFIHKGLAKRKTKISSISDDIKSKIESLKSRRMTKVTPLMKKRELRKIISPIPQRTTNFKSPTMASRNTKTSFMSQQSRGSNKYGSRISDFEFGRQMHVPKKWKDTSL